jgi:NADP-dependent aldehyde dehydrogenase
VADQAFGPSYRDASSAWIDEAAEHAAAASESFRRSSRETRARLLEVIAEGIEALGDELIETASRETALPVGRITGERGRTVGQLRRFANTLREGSYLGLRIDPAMPERAPLPRADIRQMKLAIGPVVVFGASNFPLAFSVAGGDTAAALAAGCPVIVKGHPGHPGTSELVARAITEAVAKLELPAGVFSMLHGRGVDVGGELTKHPAVQAVAFTGSLGGGRALFDVASARPRPIPVYAEMGSVNPVLMLPGAIAEGGAGLAESLANSLTLGVGQFCTNPGLVIAVSDDDASYGAFADALREQLAGKAAGVMLNPGIAATYSSELAARRDHPALQVEGRGGLGPAAETQHSAQAAFFELDASAVADAAELLEEHFGPSTLVIRARDGAEARAVIDRLEGQLTATVHGSSGELDANDAQLSSLLDALESKVGRVLFGGMPTGVEVCDAMVHGGPYPATTAASTTSVGTAAIDRFLRPVCWQNAPQSRLPAELRDENPEGLLRLIDGKWSTAPR